MSAFSAIVDELVRTASARNTRKLTSLILQNPISDEDVAYLTTALARSGVVRDFSKFSCTADVASTGGPSSLSTIVSPLYLRALGYYVPQLGVPGRPAGGIDVMAQIPRFQFRLDSKELDRVLQRSGYAHFLASETFAPLDMKFFKLRQNVGAQAIPEFVISSILAKKLAVGVKKAGLEVRVAPHGNFGCTWEIARENARRFCRVSKLLGVQSVAILTDGRFPYQPYIGRGEALIALDQLFEDVACPQLRGHFNLCFALAASTSNRRVERRASPKELQNVFTRHLAAQGTDFTAFKRAVGKIKSQPHFPLVSKREGFVRINLDVLRDVLTDVQAKFSSAEIPFADPCGIVLQTTHNSYVWKGDVLAEVRAVNSNWEELEPKFMKAFSTVQDDGVQPAFKEVCHA